MGSKSGDDTAPLRIMQVCNCLRTNFGWGINVVFGVRLCVMYTNQELAEMHFIYGKADGNAALARRLYQERYPQRQCPDRKTFDIFVIWGHLSRGQLTGSDRRDPEPAHITWPWNESILHHRSVDIGVLGI
ncbi:hypothetical protein C0J52_24880 [Blattella germanica]|nr:hypothetical protein C0J52_24880 [Blattella germanica]